MGKSKLYALVLSGIMVLAGCGIGYGGRVNGGGSFEPSEEWFSAVFNQALLTNWCYLYIDNEGPELAFCQLLGSIGEGDQPQPGRLNANFELTSCEPTSLDADLGRHVSKGRFTIDLEDGSNYICDVTDDREMTPDDLLGNYTLGNRLLIGEVSDNNLNITDPTPCVLWIGGGSPQGKPSVLTGIDDDGVLTHSGGGFLSNGNLNFHSLNAKKVEKMCSDPA